MLLRALAAFRDTGLDRFMGRGHTRERERNVLFNDALYLRLYGVRHMVKDHSDSEKGNPLLLSINSKGSFFICIILQTG